MFRNHLDVMHKTLNRHQSYIAMTFVNAENLTLAHELFEKHKNLVSKIMGQIVYPAADPYVSIEEDVSQCDNVALIDFKSSILNFRVPKLRRKTLQSKPFLMGKEPFLNGTYGWGFIISFGNQLFEFLEKLIESGVFQRVRDRFEQLDRTRFDLQYLQSLPRDVDKLKLESNFIQTLFLIYSLLSAICFGTFMVEFMIFAEILYG
ncbi:unnamed protein product [Allacma fusca]|uniref:Uncharacterized protein n=1 Tax=Allacma fusca TaxID=39272 RepID=A0A8J2PJB2_9HEXA|nr:unnamed protein product [Allacma fusca]